MVVQGDDGFGGPLQWTPVLIDFGLTKKISEKVRQDQRGACRTCLDPGAAYIVRGCVDATTALAEC